MMLTRIAMLSSILSLTVAGGAAAQQPKDKETRTPKQAMEVPKVPPELTRMADSMAGTWRCTGKAYMADGTEADVQGTVRSRLDLDKFWIHETMDMKFSNPPKGEKAAQMPAGFKSETFTTYDPQAKKWRRVAVDSMGGQMVGTSESTDPKVLEWRSEAQGHMGELAIREKFELTDAKTLKASGQRSTDNGKTWQNDYEATCKK